MDEVTVPVVSAQKEANLERVSEDRLSETRQRVAPDQFDPRYETSQWETYAFYGYYVGNNALTLFNFAPSAFQNLLSQAAGDAGVLNFAGQTRNVNRVVLLSNGISFAIQSVLFLFIGSFADFGTWRPWILIILSIVAYAVGFGWLGVHDESKWPAAVGLYIVGLIAYQLTYTFWNAAFPGLARNTLEMKAKAEAYVAGTISRDEYDLADSLMRCRIANVAYIWQSFIEVVELAIIVGILFGLHVTDSDANNNWGFSVLIAFGSAIWLVVSLPWFFFEKHRPGQDPGQKSIVVAGFWQLVHGVQAIWKLKQSLVYLIGYFLLGDSINTTITLCFTLQATAVSYNTITLTYLLIVGIAAQGVGVFTFWWCQKHFQLSTKFMFNIIAVLAVVLDGWGMVGIWTDRFGFHKEWEFWLFQVYYGGLIGPWYSYSQIMISEVTPRGHEFLFFSLFSIIGKTSSFIGPLVSSAIIDASPSHNNNMPFYFLFALSLVSCLVLITFVDLKKSQAEQAKFLDSKKKLMEEKLETASS